MNRKTILNGLLFVALTLALLLPRLPGLASFATADEPYWLSMGANFYYALGQRQFQNTVYEYQPAVTTMWIVTAAMIAYFPSYRGLGQGYLDFEKGVLDPFLLAHGKDPLILLRDARLLQVLLIVALLLVMFYLLRRLIGDGLALAATLFVSFDPFFLGQSRLLDHEALLALFVVISSLALAVYLYQGRQFRFLILSAAAGGLAQLTKSSAIAVLAPIGFLLLLDFLERRKILDSLKDFGMWLALLAVTYVVFWPGMWVAPGKMLSVVYGNAFSYAFEGARLIALNNNDATSIGLDTNPGSFGSLIYTIFWRTTPLTWLGLLLGILFPFMRDPKLATVSTRRISALMGIAALAFILMFGLAQGRNSPHYLLTTYVALNVLAGMGWFTASRWLAGRVRWAWLPNALLTLAVAAQAVSALAAYPYYFTYEDPLLPKGAKPQFAYGEGLELAAQYLAQLPGAKDSTALVYYSRGCFSYFYPGRTERFKPYFVDAGHEQDLADAMNSADYLVLYNAVQGGLDKYASLFASFANVKPEKEIWLDGYLYAVVYRLR